MHQRTAVRVIVVLSLILIVTTTFAEANLSGRWDLMMDPDFKGSPSTEHCQMKQQNRQLTVTCGKASAAMVGRVNGRNVAWKFISPGGWTAAWSGELDKAAAQIKGAWQLTLADGYTQHGSFAAQKHPSDDIHH
jgi:hypothetical protein